MQATCTQKLCIPQPHAIMWIPVQQLHITAATIRALIMHQSIALMGYMYIGPLTLVHLSTNPIVPGIMCWSSQGPI